MPDTFREQIKKILSTMRHKIETEHPDFHYDNELEAVEQILSLIHPLVKFKVLSDEEADKILEDDGVYFDHKPSAGEIHRRIQRDYCQRQAEEK